MNNKEGSQIWKSARSEEEIKKDDAARRFLQNIPSGIEIDDKALWGWAKEYNKTLYREIHGMQGSDGWYINLPGPDGKQQKIEDFRKYPVNQRPRRYMAYYSNGTFAVADSVPIYGIEVRREMPRNRMDTP